MQILRNNSFEDTNGSFNTLSCFDSHLFKILGGYLLDHDTDTGSFKFHLKNLQTYLLRLGSSPDSSVDDNVLYHT
jgi:hypothetical protein